MRWGSYVDSEEVRKAISILKAPNEVFEVRVIGNTGGRKDILSGYFRDADTLLLNFDKIDVRNRNIYITLGEVKEECFSRSQSEHFERNPSTTSDPEIVRYKWLFIDLDPVRPTGISSTDTELEQARLLMNKVAAYLSDLGFQEPVTAISGNGYHLLYRIDVLNDAVGRSVVERCLKNLSAMFDTAEVKIDTTNSNPSRICKLHGTLAQKGTSTNQRPHRMSRIISVPDPVKLTTMETLTTLARELPEDPKPKARRAYNQEQEFDLPAFLQLHGMSYTEDSNDRAKIFKLNECPFDHSHKNGDAKVFWYADGAIAFKCHHNSCRQYKWQDVRLKFEPDAYDHEQDDDRIDAGYLEHKRQQAAEHAGQDPAPKSKKKERTFRKLKTAEALMQKDIPEPVIFIGVGSELPILVEGTCILSAKPKLGKSWLALGMCLAIAKGEDFLGYHTKKCSTLYLDLETSESLQQRRLRKMLQGEEVPKNFYLDTETDTLENGFVEQIEHYLDEDPDIGLVVIDVFQIIRSPAKGIKETEYEHAYRDITPLNELAQKYHISIMLVCHDRKAVDADDPFSNILGSTGLQGAATQMMVMFRQRKDDPIHISVKGKTIDGLPELNVQLDQAQWKIVEGVDAASREQANLMAEYKSSEIREAVIAIADNNTYWRGRCMALVNDAVQLGVGITETVYHIGGFLRKHSGRFLKEDGIEVSWSENGSGSKMYKIQRQNVGTVDGDQGEPLIKWENPDKYWGSNMPFS